MRAWTKSACVVLAWSILPIILVAVAMKGSVPVAQANTRIASSSEVILTSTLGDAAHHEICRAQRRHLVRHRRPVRRARRVAGPLRGQPQGHRPRSECDPLR